MILTDRWYAHWANTFVGRQTSTLEDRQFQIMARAIKKRNGLTFRSWGRGLVRIARKGSRW